MSRNVLRRCGHRWSRHLEGGGVGEVSEGDKEGKRERGIVFERLFGNKKKREKKKKREINTQKKKNIR
jgi:hypothetical protein